MAFNPAISLTAHNRPDLLVQALDSLAAADGADRWQVYLGVEPTPQTQEILALLPRFSPRLRIQARVNDRKLGVRHNPYETVQWVLAQGHDTVLLLEDDLLVDTQALRWCELLAQGALQQPEAMCANLLTTTCMSESIFMPAASEATALADVVLKGRFFSSYGLLFTREQWQRHFVPAWFVDNPAMENFHGMPGVGWDLAMTRTLLLDKRLHVLQSLVPRVTHIGTHGTHIDQRFQDASFANVVLGLDGGAPLQTLRVLDPVADLAQVPSAAARMYINLARHLWTLQASSLTFKHGAAGLFGAKPHWRRFGKHEFVWFSRRVAK